MESEKKTSSTGSYRFTISLDETKGVVSYADLIAKERQKRKEEALALLASQPSDPLPLESSQPATPPLSLSQDANESMEGMEGESFEGSMEASLDTSVDLGEAESDEEKKEGEEKSLTTSSAVNLVPFLPKKKAKNRLVQIIDKIEKMYTSGGDSFMQGYDTSDSFIDDSDMVERQVEVLEKLYKDKKYGLAIVSSSAIARVLASIKQSKQDVFFPIDHVFSAASSLPSPSCKPDPAVYLHACKIVGKQPTECIAVEDSRSGTLSAVRAGIPVIGYVGCYPESKREDMEKILRETGCKVIMRHWSEFEKCLELF